MLKILICLSVILNILAVMYAMVHVNGVNCFYNKDICKPAYCMMTRSRGQMTYFSAACFVRVKLSELLLNIRMMRKEGANYRFLSLNVEQNLCDFSNLTTKNFFVNRMFTMVSKYVKNLHCPLMGNVSINKLPFMLYMAQGIFTEGDYVIQGKVTTNKLQVLDLNISYTLNKDTIITNRRN